MLCTNGLCPTADFIIDNYNSLTIFVQLLISSSIIVTRLVKRQSNDVHGTAPLQSDRALQGCILYHSMALAGCHHPSLVAGSRPPRGKPRFQRHHPSSGASVVSCTCLNTLTCVLQEAKLACMQIAVSSCRFVNGRMHIGVIDSWIVLQA